MSKESQKSKIRPAISPETRENRLINLAMNLAEEKLLNGTASAQLIIEFLKRGATKTRLENEKLRQENELLKAKTANLEAQRESKELYSKAISAWKRYAGFGVSNEDIFDEEDMPNEYYD